MIPSRKIVRTARFREQLRAAGIGRGDERLKACEWYLKHDPRHRDSRAVRTLASGDTLFAYRTASTKQKAALLVFYVSRKGGMEIVLEGVMAPVAE